MATNNNAALRDAIKEISELADALDTNNPNVVAILDKCRDALALPRRNCNVPSRFRGYCAICDGSGCNHRQSKKDSALCALNKTQMPYEEGGNDDSKVHAAVSIMGRESINKQCWECGNCKEPTAGWDASKFHCAYLGKDFGTWHYDVPIECPCKGKGWMPEKKEGVNDAD